MTENTMPATEAQAVTMEPERASYELAFHILPTVTEGEVPEIVANLKNLITTAKGEIFDEEAPERFTLAYEIEKYLEGKYRKFTSAYFGWLRFTLEPAAVAELNAEVEGNNRILRHLCIRLTKAEEANPFRFHEALASESGEVETIDVDATIADTTDAADAEAEAVSTAEVETKTDEANPNTDESTKDAATTEPAEADTMTNETPKGN